MKVVKFHPFDSLSLISLCCRKSPKLQKSSRTAGNFGITFDPPAGSIHIILPARVKKLNPRFHFEIGLHRGTTLRAEGRFEEGQSTEIRLPKGFFRRKTHCFIYYFADGQGYSQDFYYRPPGVK